MPASGERPESLPDCHRPRVLHVLGALTLGGVETWLMHMLRHRDQFAVDHEVLLAKAEPGAYEDEARRLGVRIHRLPQTGSRLRWLRSFRRFLATEGKFDVVHSHVYFFSAAVLASAKAQGVPVRIAHCHTARSRGADHRTLRHRLRRASAILWLKRVATRRIGISDAAIAEIAGSSWKSDPSASVLIYGFDFDRYAGAAERGAKLRERLAIDRDAKVIGHVGRFETVKNHPFLLDAFESLLEVIPEARLVLVGDGPERASIERLVKSRGLESRVQLPGTSHDVPACMALFDLFVLPSLSEGLGIVCVEAQAAGTPAIVSDAVPGEVAVIPGMVDHLSLDLGAGAWADVMARRLHEPRGDAALALRRMEASRFGLRRCVDELNRIYRSELALPS